MLAVHFFALLLPLTRACIFSLDDQMSWNSLLLGLVMTNTKNSNCWRASSAGSADLDLRNENCGH